jgi:hypothetical protein
MTPTAAEAALQTIGKTIRQLARVPSQAARGAAPRIAELLQNQFDEGVDPYGDPWAPLMPSTMARGRTPPPLTDTGDMRDLTVEPSGSSGIAIHLGAGYSAFHQVGTKTMDARPILPVHGIPNSWHEAIVEETRSAVKRALP